MSEFPIIVVTDIAITLFTDDEYVYLAQWSPVYMWAYRTYVAHEKMPFISDLVRIYILKHKKECCQQNICQICTTMSQNY